MAETTIEAGPSGLLEHWSENGCSLRPEAEGNHVDEVAAAGLRVAVIHEWLSTYAGSEQVLSQIFALYPQADLFAVVDFIGPDHRALLDNRKATVSFVQHLPLARKRFRWYLPLMPFAVEQFDLSAYDLIISNSHAVSKGVLTRGDQLHISYVHTPIRYAWDLQEQYLSAAGGRIKTTMARLLMHYLRIWDLRTATGVDRFVANSRCVAQRIMRTYRRKAIVLYPPVNLDEFQLHTKKEDFYVVVSRLVPYKRVDLLLEAFTQIPHRQLVVIGEGPELAKLRRKAPSNVALKGRLGKDEMKDYIGRAKAFVYAGEEDFGIAMVEAQACGTPVIAFAKGGAAEIVRSGDTGLLFARQTSQAIVDAIAEFERSGPFDPARIRSNAMQFGVNRFREGFRNVVNQALRERQTSDIQFTPYDSDGSAQHHSRFNSKPMHNY